MAENRDTSSDKLLGSDLKVSSKKYGNLLSINMPEETERDTFERHDIISDEINDRDRLNSAAEIKEVAEN